LKPSFVIILMNLLLLTNQTQFRRTCSNFHIVL